MRDRLFASDKREKKTQRTKRLEHLAFPPWPALTPGAFAILVALWAPACKSDHTLCQASEIERIRLNTKEFVQELRSRYPELGPAVVDTTPDPCRSGKLYQINYATESQREEIRGIVARYPALEGRVRYRNW